VVKNPKGEIVSFCLFCKSATDHVLQRSMWSCGTHFNDPHWRTKECYKRELKSANERIAQLEQENDALRADLLLWENGGPLP
jgi:hypothetical protein